MGGDFKGTTLKAGGFNAHKWQEEAVATETIAIGDVLKVTDRLGNYPKVAKADADLSADGMGPLYIAATKGVSGSRMAILSRGAIFFNTTGATLGDPVFLSGTAGGITLTATGGNRRIGSVGKVGTVAAGGFVLFDGSAPSQQIIKTGTAAVAGAASVTVLAATIGGNFGGRRAFAICSTVSGVIHVTAYTWSTNDLVITLSASYTGNVDWMVFLF